MKMLHLLAEPETHAIGLSQRTTPYRTAIAGLAGWLREVPRRLRDRSRSRADRRQMHLVEMLPLGGKRQLMLVNCNGEQFLVGTGQESVQTIVRIGRCEAQGHADERVDGNGEGPGEQT